MILNENVSQKIIPIAGGKGGVGKSVLAMNIALSLAKFDKKVLLVDLDLGGSNLHTLLGLKNTNPGIGNFLSGRVYKMNDLICPTKWKNLNLIPGDVLVYGLGELSKTVKTRVMKGLLNLEADYILIDLGGGTNFTVIDFFLISNSGFVITTPQNTSITNAYSFIKNYVLRFLQRAFSNDKTITAYFQKVFKIKRPNEKIIVADMITDLSQENPSVGEKIRAFLAILQPKIILNKVETSEDLLYAENLRDLCKRNLSINIECLGAIMNSKLMDSSVNSQRPFIVENPEDILTEEFYRISQKIIQSQRFPDMPLELDYYSDSFDLAHIEIENDLTKHPDSQNLEKKSPENSKNHKVDNLVELISAQQKKINELQGTVRMLTLKQD